MSIADVTSACQTPPDNVRISVSLAAGRTKLWPPTTSVLPPVTLADVSFRTPEPPIAVVTVVVPAASVATVAPFSTIGRFALRAALISVVQTPLTRLAVSVSLAPGSVNSVPSARRSAPPFGPEISVSGAVPVMMPALVVPTARLIVVGWFSTIAWPAAAAAVASAVQPMPFV